MSAAHRYRDWYEAEVARAEREGRDLCDEADRLSEAHHRAQELAKRLSSRRPMHENRALIERAEAVLDARFDRWFNHPYYNYDA